MRDIAIIELRNGDFSNINSLYLDENIFEKHPEYNYKDIYILHYEFGKEAKYSPGIITSFDKALIYNTKLYYNCSTQPGSSGGPILNSKNYKIIGVHKGFDPNKMLNKGCMLWRGNEIPQEIKNINCYDKMTFKKLDYNQKRDQQLVHDYWTKIGEKEKVFKKYAVDARYFY